MPLVQLGYVARPNGLRGAVVAHVDPTMHDAFTKGLELELRPRSGPVRRTRVRGVAPIRGGLRLVLDGVDDRDASEALVGATLFAERERLANLGEGSFLDSDIVGLLVVGDDGRELGRVSEVIATGANDVYAVAGEAGEILVPAVAHAVLDVDLEAGRMTVARDALEYPEAPKPAAARERPAKPPKRREASSQAAIPADARKPQADGTGGGSEDGE